MCTCNPPPRPPPSHPAFHTDHERGLGGGLQSFSCPSSAKADDCDDWFKGATTGEAPALLQVLQDASVSEVVDVPAEVHQLGVDVHGHAAVGGRGEVGPEGHHAGPARWGAFSTPLHQGTKSANETVRRDDVKANLPQERDAEIRRGTNDSSACFFTHRQYWARGRT